MLDGFEEVIKTAAGLLQIGKIAQPDIIGATQLQVGFDVSRVHVRLNVINQAVDFFARKASLISHPREQYAGGHIAPAHLLTDQSKRLGVPLR